MPTYDYECDKCGYRFEKFQKMSDELLKSCPKCGGNVVRLIGSGSGVIFKGSGFYATDYKDKKRPKENKPCTVSKPGGCKNCPMGENK